MLPLADQASITGLLSVMGGIILVILAARLHRLYSTGLTFWGLLAAGSIAVSALASCLMGLSIAAGAIADLCLMVAGFSAYAASRWLRERFEMGAGYGG